MTTKRCSVEHVKADIESAVPDYEAPRLDMLGTLAELTLGAGLRGLEAFGQLSGNL